MNEYPILVDAASIRKRLDKCSAPTAGRRVSAVMRRDTERRGVLIAIEADVVDTLASLDTIHYLLKVSVFDLQFIADQ